MKLEITQQLINRGQQYKCRLCPVALAVQERFGLTPQQVTVSSFWVSIPGRMYKLSPETTDWIQRFDTFGHKDVKPFTAVLIREP